MKLDFDRLANLLRDYMLLGSWASVEHALYEPTPKPGARRLKGLLEQRSICGRRPPSYGLGLLLPLPLPHL